MIIGALQATKIGRELVFGKALARPQERGHCLHSLARRKGPHRGVFQLDKRGHKVKVGVLAARAKWQN